MTHFVAFAFQAVPFSQIMQRPLNSFPKAFRQSSLIKHTFGHLVPSHIKDPAYIPHFCVARLLLAIYENIGKTYS